MESIKQLLKNFSTDMKIRGMSEHTQRSYTQHVERFLRLRKRPAEEIDEREAREFIIELLRDGKVCVLQR
jgi:site-specific recombinase XerD